jgi:AcrR family transcriptional regulator
VPKRDGGTAATDAPSRSGDTARAILQAARSRFAHYGFKKTTIDEIAQDAGVGKGTVYLYFDGKDEILLTLILAVKRNITDQIRAIDQAMAPPEDKIRRMVMACIETVYDACSSTAHGSELVDDLRPQLLKHPEFQQQFAHESEVQLGLIAEALREGNARGAFDAPDVEKTAHLIMAAFVAYLPPYISPAYPRQRSRRDIKDGANDMLDLLLQGLRRCP